jgi:hypothetical protein
MSKTRYQKRKEKCIPRNYAYLIEDDVFLSLDQQRNGILYHCVFEQIEFITIKGILSNYDLDLNIRPETKIIIYDNSLVGDYNDIINLMEKCKSKNSELIVANSYTKGSKAMSNLKIRIMACVEEELEKKYIDKIHQLEMENQMLKTRLSELE